MKKFFSLVLALVMALSLTTVAWGASVDETALKTAAANGGSVTLDQNITLTETLNIAAGKSVTIDLNGFSISGDYSTVGAYLIKVANTGELTVKDSSNPSTGKISHNNLTGPTRVTGDTVYLEGVFNLQSGTIEQNGYWSTSFVVDVHPNAWGADYTAATVFNMSGGKVTNSGQSDSCVRLASTSADGGAHPVYSGVSAVFNMTAGEIVAVRDAVFIQQSNSAYDVLDVNISGGTLSGGNSVVRLYGPAPTSSVDGTDTPMALELTGGTYTYTGSGSSYESVIDGVLVVAGGASAATFVKSMDFTADESFVEDMSDDLVLIDNGDGTYDVHATLADAVEAAQDGDTIVLLGDNDEDIALDKSVTIDTNGFTTTVSAGDGYQILQNTDGTSVVVPAVTTGDKFDLYLADATMNTMLKLKTPKVSGLTFDEVGAKTNKDGSGRVAYIAANNGQYFVKTNNPTIVDYAVTDAGKNTVLYYVTVAGTSAANFEYEEAVSAFTNFGVKCDQVNITPVAGATYFKAADGDVYMADDAGTGVNYLLNGKVVSGVHVGTPEEHTFVINNYKYDATLKQNIPTSAVCTKCLMNTGSIYLRTKVPATYTLYTTTGEGSVNYTVALPGTAAVVPSVPSTDKVTSAETFDAGIAMYVGMSVMAAAGSAVVIGKKKD